MNQKTALQVIRTGAICAAVMMALAQPSAFAQDAKKPVAAAQPGGPATAVSQLKAFVANTKAAKGRFDQTPAQGEAGEASRGSFVFARPGKFRWEVTEPYPQLLVADGAEVFFHDPDLNQVTIRPMQGALGATPAAILFGTGELDENFEMSELPMTDGVNWLQAIPKVKEAGFEQIRIGFKDNVPVAMQVLDAFNRTTNFAFADIVSNPKLSPQTFSFKIPEGADVVRQ